MKKSQDLDEDQRNIMYTLFTNVSIVSRRLHSLNSNDLKENNQIPLKITFSTPYKNTNHI